MGAKDMNSKPSYSLDAPDQAKISLLSRSELDALDADIRESSYGDIHGVTRRLNSRGHAIGKSAVGVYALDLKKRDRSTMRGIDADSVQAALRSAEIRMRCLEAAQRACSGAPLAAQRELAREFADWVFKG